MHAHFIGREHLTYGYLHFGIRCADTTSAKRKSLIFFAGKDSSAIRQMVADGLKDDPDAYHSHGRMNQSQYVRNMLHSIVIA